MIYKSGSLHKEHDKKSKKAPIQIGIVKYTGKNSYFCK